MNIIKALRAWGREITNITKKMLTLPPGKPEVPNLVSAVDSARFTWQQALREFNQVDQDCCDHVIYKINSAERYYMLLLKQACQEGTVAWPDHFR